MFFLVIRAAKQQVERAMRTQSAPASTYFRLGFVLNGFLLEYR